MTLIKLLVLSVIQGLAELLPVSSSAHVIVAAKLMHLDPTTPQFTLLLVMLHTGTMFAVIVYFWKAWKQAFFSSRQSMALYAEVIAIATAVTGVIGLALKFVIEAYLKHRHPGLDKGEIEELFGNLPLIAAGLTAAGLLIIYTGLRRSRRQGSDVIAKADGLFIGAVQGLCLPFRGFSRSGSTISTGLWLGIARARVEEFSFALAVVLTPAVLLLEIRRLFAHHDNATAGHLGLHDFMPGLLGMVLSFFAGLVALRVLSRVLEKGRWWMFGVYCLAAAAGVFAMHLAGY